MADFTLGSWNDTSGFAYGNGAPYQSTARFYLSAENYRALTQVTNVATRAMERFAGFYRNLVPVGLVTRRARERLALARTRSFCVPYESAFCGEPSRLVIAPRRTVVPHGFVSWVRAGTRRPL